VLLVKRPLIFVDLYFGSNLNHVCLLWFLYSCLGFNHIVELIYSVANRYDVVLNFLLVYT